MLNIFKTSNLKPFITFIIFAFFSSSSIAKDNEPFGNCKHFFPNGVPPVITSKSNVPGNLRALCFSSFAILYSGQSKTPVYVVEKLNRQSLERAKGEDRTENFYEEARLPFSDRSSLSDYKHSGFDRGHMAPAADMSNEQSMSQSFSLANMVPQYPEHNRNLWAKSVEKPTRQYVMRATGDVYVFTGPQYFKPISAIGKNQVWVPSVLVKLVYDPNTKKAWAHWSENNLNPVMSRPISYQELFNRTGIDFLPGINLNN